MKLDNKFEKKEDLSELNITNVRDNHAKMRGIHLDDYTR